MMLRTKIASVLLALLVAGGCGYTTRSTLPAHFRTIYIEDFKNKISFSSAEGRDIYIPLLEIKTRNAVVDRYLFDGNLRVAKSEEADLILRGELKRYRRDELRRTDDDETLEYRVIIDVGFVLWDTRKQEPVWSEPNFYGEAEYFVSGSEATTEEAAIDDAITDLARRIVERTIENW